MKYSKFAIRRTAIKRLILNYIRENSLDKKDVSGKYYKIFVNMNKKNIWDLKNQVEKFDKVQANNYILQDFQKSFLFFLSKIWK